MIKTMGPRLYVAADVKGEHEPDLLRERILEIGKDVIDAGAGIKLNSVLRMLGYGIIADGVIMGRPILGAEDRYAAAERAVAEITAALRA